MVLSIVLEFLQYLSILDRDKTWTNIGQKMDKAWTFVKECLYFVGTHILQDHPKSLYIQLYSIQRKDLLLWVTLLFMSTLTIKFSHWIGYWMYLQINDTFWTNCLQKLDIRFGTYGHIFY